MKSLVISPKVVGNPEGSWPRHSQRHTLWRSSNQNVRMRGRREKLECGLTHDATPTVSCWKGLSHGSGSGNKKRWMKWEEYSPLNIRRDINLEEEEMIFREQSESNHQTSPTPFSPGWLLLPLALKVQHPPADSKNPTFRRQFQIVYGFKYHHYTYNTCLSISSP